MPITIPTAELLGCLTDVAGLISNPKESPTGGIAITWDGDELHFTTYDVNAAGDVVWTPGEGAEAGMDDETVNVPRWGGDDSAWRVFIWFADAKEIIKLFRLPAKLWWFPVTLDVGSTGMNLTVRRDDMARGRRQLVIGTDNEVIAKFQAVHDIATDIMYGPASARAVSNYATDRLAAFGAIRPHGPLSLIFGGEGEPTAIMVGSRFRGYLYPQGVGAQPFNLLRDGAGVVTTPADPDLNVL